MTILTKEIQEKFATENFNKIVLHGSVLGRFIGYIETADGFCNVFSFPSGVQRRTVFIDAGLRVTFIEPENPLYAEINDALKRTDCPELKNIFYKEVKNDPLFSADRRVYLQANASLFFNKIILSYGNALRIVGFSFDDYGNSYIAHDVKGNVCYIDSMNTLKENELSLEFLEYLEHIIPRKDTLMFEDLTAKD